MSPQMTLNSLSVPVSHRNSDSLLTYRCIGSTFVCDICCMFKTLALDRFTVAELIFECHFSLSAMSLFDTGSIFDNRTFFHCFRLTPYFVLFL